MEIIWKDYPENNNYKVSNDGRIYSKRYGKELTPKSNWDGYSRIQIYDKGECTMIGWHRVVAQTFIPNPENKKIVNHINGIKTDNRVENLEWCTQKENIQHSWENGLSKRANRRVLKRKVDQFTIYGEYLKTWDCMRDIERAYGMCNSNIKRACESKTNYAKGFKWKYNVTSND